NCFCVPDPCEYSLRMCWYWGALTSLEARQILNQTTEGTFLIRDSSNPEYLLTLSVKTSSGPAHLRIEYNEGKFGFDSVVLARPKLRNFEDVVDLVQHYILIISKCLPSNCC
uniref:SH2 domain-containing protein n=1 Tax=Callorhinchus milii TaxID=7868 RepID=A0A4W3GG30_CALMI